MHYGRITTVVGSVLAIIGLGLKSASSAAEDLMPQLNQLTDKVPSEFDRILIAMWDDNLAGTSIFLIALVVVLGVSLIPDIKEALSRMNGLVVTVLGVVMMIAGIIATVGASDKASNLEAGFGDLVAAGAIPEAFTVSISVGWYLLIIGGVVAAIGGVLALIARPDENALDG
jgi:hypothetical protein